MTARRGLRRSVRAPALIMSYHIVFHHIVRTIHCTDYYVDYTLYGLFTLYGLLCSIVLRTTPSLKTKTRPWK